MCSFVKKNKKSLKLRAPQPYIKYINFFVRIKHKKRTKVLINFTLDALYKNYKRRIWYDRKKTLLFFFQIFLNKLKNTWLYSRLNAHFCVLECQPFSILSKLTMISQNNKLKFCHYWIFIFSSLFCVIERKTVFFFKVKTLESNWVFEIK